MTVHLTPRAVATLVAALHAWQNELSYHTVEELRDYHPELCGHEPLSVDEVEGLLTQLHKEAGNATVSSVSTVSANGAGSDR